MGPKKNNCKLSGMLLNNQNHRKKSRNKFNGDFHFGRPKWSSSFAQD